MSNYEIVNSREVWHITDRFTPIRYKQMAERYHGCPRATLDVGIGSGIGGIILKKFFRETILYGLDAVEERAKSAPKCYEKVFYGSALKTNFEDNTFDLIVAGELIEHISVSDVDNFLQEIFRILTIGGFFILTTPNPGDIKLRFRKRSVLGGSHVSQHFISDTEIRLRQNSFRVLKTLGTGKTSQFIGMNMPKFLYGSYMIVSRKF